ncbi:hypothetical protein CTI12_AA576200 [Artemisia annua]|uniref:Uncharacterized protein n=1 Tax=Artemisia annua TaxID=35608 RepID=A0A2U1KQH8_ARTAN|nr:hypothetical protein CTI12_AA576200 [Artemisia annua]
MKHNDRVEADFRMDASVGIVDDVGQFQVFSSTNTQVDMASHVQDQFVTQMVHNSAFFTPPHVDVVMEDVLDGKPDR